MAWPHASWARYATAAGGEPPGAWISMATAPGGSVPPHDEFTSCMLRPSIRDAYQEFCATHLSHLDEIAHAWFTSPELDDVLVRTVRSTFPAHEQDHFVEHYRGLLGAWARDNETVSR